MKRRNCVLGVLLSAAMAVSMLSGCGAASGTASGTSSAAAGTASGTASAAAATEKIKFAVCGGSEESMVLDTSLVGTLEGLSACRHLYEGLFKIDSDGQVTNGQCKDYKMSDDGLTYTFTLRDDIKWSDGKDVTAGDFVNGWLRVIKSGEDYAGILDMVKGAEDIRKNSADDSTLGAVATDDKTLTVTLTQPCSYFKSVLAFPSTDPVRKDIADAQGSAYATDPDKAVYNGAYELTSWSHQDNMVMTARKDYYDYDNISAAEITWKLLSDEATALSSFQSGDIIYSDSYPNEEITSLKDNGLQEVSGFNTICTMFNCGEKGPAVLKDARVRKALSLVIDRDRIVKNRAADDDIATSYCPMGITDADGKDFHDTVTPWFDQSKYEDNCKEAQQLLSDAGYPGGANFPALEYLVNNASRQTIAEEIIDDWKQQLGITSITVNLNSDSFWDARESGDYDIAYYGWYMDYIDVSNMLGTMKTGGSDADYSSSDFDAAFSSAMSATDTASQWADYDKCEQILANDYPVAPLYYGKNTYLFDDKKYTGLVYSCGNFYFGYVKNA
ncbi:MAG TPA: peptide ABC transporter substrate-binding protein [Lachnospiraceae bacterium]|nr:peptide ABC transporter substrate-binding protein [Lachnospiraceae bacterium]